MASGETTTCVTWVVVERADNVGFCWLTQLTPNLGPSPLNPTHVVTHYEGDQSLDQRFDILHSVDFGDLVDLDFSLLL